MLTSHEYDVLFTKWKMSHGTEKTSKQGTVFYAVPVNSSARRLMLQVLVDTLIDNHSYTEEDFGAVTCNNIVEACVWADLSEKENLRKWRQAARTDLLTVLAITFTKEGDTVVKERSSRERNVIEDYIPNEPEDLGPPVVQEINPEEIYKKTGIPAPNTELDLDFLKLLEGSNDE